MEVLLGQSCVWHTSWCQPSLSLPNRHNQVVHFRCIIGHTRVTHCYILTGDDVPFCIACDECFLNSMILNMIVIDFIESILLENFLPQLIHPLLKWSKFVYCIYLTNSLVPTQFGLLSIKIVCILFSIEHWSFKQNIHDKQPFYIIS
jgi:hypothetical protein